MENLRVLKDFDGLKHSRYAKRKEFKFVSGVYFLTNHLEEDVEELIYIGKAKNIGDRLYGHKGIPEGEKIFDSFYYLEIEEDWECSVIEKIYIELYAPKYNGMCNGDPIYKKKRLEKMLKEKGWKMN